MATRKLTIYRARGLKRARDSILAAIAQHQLDSEEGSGFIVEEDEPMLGGKYVETLELEEEVFDVKRLAFMPKRRFHVQLCQFLLDFTGEWIFFEGPPGNAKRLLSFLTELAQPSVAIEPCSLELAACLDVLGAQYGDFSVFKLRVAKVLLEHGKTLFSGELEPRGWQRDESMRMAQHWRSLCVIVSDDEAESKLTLGRKGVLQVAAELWGDRTLWTRFLVQLVRASDNQTLAPE